MTLADTPVEKDEILSRFILQSRWIRNSDNTIRHEAFMPHPDSIDLSVTRQRNLEELEIWRLGEEVSNLSNRTLYGRGDISAGSVIEQNLFIEPSEPPLNHANIKGFPGDKSKQKLIAMELSSNAVFVSNS